MVKPIAFIAPYKKLADLFAEVANDLDKDVAVYIGDLKEGIEIAKDLEDKGTQVIISRGGTALAISEQLDNYPLVEIMINGFDLIKILNEAREKSRKIVIAGFYQFTYDIENLDHIMDIDVKVITLQREWFNRPEYIKEKLQDAKKNGYNCLVGDNISVKIADELGFETFLIRSGRSALAQSIIEAERILKVKKNEMEKTHKIKSIIDSVNDGIISLNSEGKIQIFNPKAEKILDKKAYQVKNKYINEIIPQINYKKVLEDGLMVRDNIYKVNGQKIISNLIPIKVDGSTVGLVISFQKAEEIKKSEEVIRNELQEKGYTAKNTFNDIIGKSNKIEETKNEAKNYAQVEMPLLINGETGTGKELFAQAIHNYSSRANKSFVAFNCAALPDKLLESELFGYVKGAFTGADKKGKAGLFEQAHNGTIFLDEIAEISLNTQTKLLRVFEERKVRKIGDDKLTPINVRIIMATNKSINKLVTKGDFREDLYYRINVLKLNIPPLRERKKDIPLLIEYFINKSSNKINKVITGISKKSEELLMQQYWPGNVRQLENIIERIVVNSNENYIKSDIVKKHLAGFELNNKKINFSKGTIPNKTLEELEKEIIKIVVEEEESKTAAANRLGIGRTTLWRKMNS